MIALALVLVAAAALACASLLWPLRNRRTGPDAAAVELAIYRDQLAELDRDAARGVVDAAQAKAARIEIERRMLKVAPGAELVERPGSRKLLAAVAVALPVVAGGVYLTLGSPDLPSVPFASRPSTGQSPVELAELQLRLEARTAQTPNDAETWVMLGRVRGALGAAEQAVEAFQQALKLDPQNADAQVGIVEALTAASDGTVPPAAVALLDRLVAQGLGGPRIAYYRGLVAAQNQDWKAAIDRWREALAASEPDAPWRPQIERSIRDAAAQAGVDPEKALADLPEPPKGPTAEEVQAAQSMTPEQQQEMIRGMVGNLEARLAENGDDVEGWLRLARSRMVLGEPEKAAEAFAKAGALRPDSAEIALGEGEARLGPDDPQSGLPKVGDAALAAFKRAQATAPDDARVNWYLGVRAVQDGDKALAKTHWTKLLALLPADSPDRARLQDLIAALGA